MVGQNREIAKKLAAKIHRKKWILAASLLMSESSRFGPGIVKGARLRHRTNHPATAGMQFIAFYLRRTINWRSSLAPLTSFFASFLGCPKKDGPATARVANEKADAVHSSQNQKRFFREKHSLSPVHIPPEVSARRPVLRPAAELADEIAAEKQHNIDKGRD